MNRKLAIFASVIAVFAFAAQGAEAHSHWHAKKKLAAVAIGVGAASTVAYFAINDWHTGGWNNSSGLTPLGAWGITTIGCAAVSPMVGTVVLDRPLTMREAHILIGSCVIPLVGGWLVNQAYKAHPDWDPGSKPHHRMKMHEAMK
jgi:hypothetical protein